MTQLVRWEPFGEFQSLRRAMDRLFEDFAPARVFRENGPAELMFPVDVSDSDASVTVKAVLPGVKPEDVEITVAEGVLTIKGEAHEEKREESENYYRREIRYGAFARSIPLPAAVDQGKAEAEFSNGMLTVTLPKTEETRPRQIKVKTAA